MECAHQNESYGRKSVFANWENDPLVESILSRPRPNKVLSLGVSVFTSGRISSKRSFKEVKLLLLIVIDSQ